ncbi:MAG: hypothetical protein JXB35_12890 [Anaerolineae bacterium]|nr:hypothetical protein [Anaerolineae bacterium]
MVVESAQMVLETKVYGGFPPVSRALMRAWKNQTIELGAVEHTSQVFRDIDRRLLSDNIIVFIDHHYAFDSLPAGLAMGESLRNLDGLLIPYAAHLDMGLDPEGRPSLRYRWRTWAFHYLMRKLRAANPTLRILPIVREFEENNPRLKAFADREHAGANTQYLKALVELFTHHPNRQMCFLAPASGIAFPWKPVLHPQLYRSMDLVQRRYGRPIPFYLVGGYPNWSAHRHYLAPLLAKHTVVARGPFELPRRDYEAARAIIVEQRDLLRAAAEFTEPDYTRIEHK